MSLAPLHVIVGSGQIGPLVAQRLLDRGMRVRMIRRSSAPLPANVEGVVGDIADPAFAKDALRGAATVYHCANPRYHRWGAELLPLAQGIATGAAAAGARLVVLDNLYMYRVPSDGRIAESASLEPSSKKGRLRVQVAELLLGYHARGEAPVVLARASDFVGPNSQSALFGERFWQRLAAKKPVELLGDPDQPHSFTYTEDVADGLVELAFTEADAYGRAWHLPTAPALTPRAWVEEFAQALGVPPRVFRLRGPLLWAAGLFIPEARELPEMLYQWTAPFVIDDAAYRARFNRAPTPVDRIVRDTVAWARGAFKL
jgi:nucleoside-diphosphate-sugar epimerase